MENIKRQIREDLPFCMLKEQYVISRRLSNKKLSQKELISLQKQVEASKHKAESRKNFLPKVNYPGDLPVTERKDEIKALIEKNQVVILSGETGSGKTTQLPKICLELGLGVKGYIGHTQPRRIAARTVANRVASELNCKVGESVGYKVRFGDHVSENTHVKLMTDGILLAEIQTDRQLLQYEVLIIDEAHERSLNIDFILGILKTLLAKRPNLKLIITSATIDTQKFSNHFNNAPVIEVSGRTFPVHILYHPIDDKKEDASLQASISDAVFELTRQGPGDTLVFLPGEREIRETAEYLRKHHPPHTEILPLFARLSVKDQEKIFKSHQGRRVVLATNVAETSLTVPGIKYVVDAGLARISRYSVRSRMQRLPIEPVSQSAANQRSGRCGRVSSGTCIRLYSEQDFINRPEFTDPEILRVNLASAILQMLHLKIGDVYRFPFINPPERKHINDGMKLLHELGAVNSDGEITESGRLLARFPIDPGLAKMILQANHEGCLSEVLIITSFLSIQDPRERPFDAQQKADEYHSRFADKESDFLSILKLWEYYQDQSKHLSQSKLRKLCKAEFISYLRMREWKDIWIQLKAQTSEMSFRPNDNKADYGQLHRALLSGLLGNIGFRSDAQEFSGTRQKKFFIFPGSHIQKKPPKWIMASEIVETSRSFARNAAKIDPEWLVSLAGHIVNRSYYEPHWQKNASQVGAFERISLYGLIIVQKRRVNYGPISPVESREIFIRHALVNGELKTSEKFLEINRKTIEEIEKEEHKSRRPDILIGEEELYEYFDQIIPENIYSGHAFHKWYKGEKKHNPNLLVLSKEQLIRKTDTGINKHTHPEKLTIEGLVIPLKYNFQPGSVNDGVTAQISIALLNRLKPVWFEWVVPGLLSEKVSLLIKTLPKSIRRNFVPVPEYAKAFVDSANEYHKPLLEELSHHLFRLSAVKVSSEDFELEKLPSYLFFNFELIDQNRNVLASGKNLSSLVEKCSSIVEKEISHSPVEKFEKSGITQWDFGNLNKEMEITSESGSYVTYPALIDEKDTVAIKLFANKTEAVEKNKSGLLRLIKLNLKDKVQYIQKNLKHIDKMCMFYAPLGQCKELRESLLDYILREAFELDNLSVYSEQEFNSAINETSPKLVDLANKVCDVNLSCLKQFHSCNKQLKSVNSPAYLESLSDVKNQINHLVYRNYLGDTPLQWLEQLPRYFQAISCRLEKLSHSLVNDRKHFLVIRKYWNEYETLSKAKQIDPVELTNFRWMIEEMRVSLWAQELKTRFPISEKRLDKQLKLLRK